MMGLRGCTGATVGLLLLHIAHGARKDTSGEAAASSHRVIFFIVGAHEVLICMADSHRDQIRLSNWSSKAFQCPRSLYYKADTFGGKCAGGALSVFEATYRIETDAEITGEQFLKAFQPVLVCT